jgi:hypothetical protein
MHGKYTFRKRTECKSKIEVIHKKKIRIKSRMNFPFRHFSIFFVAPIQFPLFVKTVLIWWSLLLKLWQNTVYLLIKTNVENFVSEFMFQFLQPGSVSHTSRNKVLAHRERKEREREWFSEGLGNCLVNIQLYSYGNCIAIYVQYVALREREKD